MRTPHNRALVPVAAASSVPGEGGGFWTGRFGGGAARCGGAAALPASRVCRRRLWGWGGAAS